MQSTVYQRTELQLALWYGLGLIMLIALGLSGVEGLEWVSLSVVALVLVLGVATVIDQTHMRWRGAQGARYPLSSEGLARLQAELNPAVKLCVEEGFEAELVEYDELELGALEPLSEAEVGGALKAFERLSSAPGLAIEPSLRLSVYLEAVTLPNLPQVEGRDQLGLFATEVVPAGHIFLWESDLGLARSESRDQLPDSVRMNRRTLCKGEGVDLFQGGGREQRSTASILANFYWCHSESSTRQQGRFLIYPPHYFGPPNCEYVTTLNAQGAPCSGLKTLRALAPGEQLLMYTGSGRSALTIQLRVAIGWLVRLLAPASSLLPWLWSWAWLQ